ncbi:TonB-dependent receptor [Pseudochryseolinea flava]|uniref:TonB-dependent receptor n=2 Tax=Pseudochryseolinea flava TaxID=2059302 RepID=A0A364Y9A6_9BACT|nr:TonB-dependent receptor [Pseudochryseolinea flava]
MLLLVHYNDVVAQSTQTIRGRIVDEVTQTPLVGVSITITTSTDKLLGTITDAEGNFRIDNVPVGRQILKITYVGFQEQTIPNTVVTAGKEVVLNVSLVENVNNLNEVVVTGDGKEDKTATNNDLAVVSARSFNVDDTKRYAGALGDPSRMAANFAGVIGGDDSRNDIVVRGNSPTGMLWQLEGLNIPNPNHFGALVSTGGPVSILNNNNIDKSDFMTSAFPAQYGNATAGVFDLKLRDGNNQQTEFIGQVGFNGFEFGAEGPFKKNSDASYIVNYRYSTLAIFNALGMEFGTGSNIPYYQDLNFKISLPSSGNGKWTLFGLGGKSEIDLLGSEAEIEGDDDLYGDANADAYPRYQTGIVGLSYETNLSDKTFAKFTAGISSTEENWHSDSLVRNQDNIVIGKHLEGEAKFTTTKYSVNFLTRTKFSAKNSITSGVTVDAMQFGLYNREAYANLGRDTVRLDVDESATLFQGFSTWRHRFNNNFSVNTGVHTQYYTLNEQWAVEPRVSVQYIVNPKHSLSLGYGLHHQVQNITTSFMQTKTLTGPILTNKDLDFTRSQHYVLTYDWNVTPNSRLKAEAYYQNIDKAPVEAHRSSFSALNTGASFGPVDEDSLVNNGTGTNYGIELTLERFYNRGFYYLVTTSIFDSKYKGSDGIERNTAFNTGYVLNVLAGKEWKIGSNGKFFSVSLKVTTIGGKYLTPVDVARSQQYQRTIYKDGQAYSDKQDPYFRTDLKLSYRKEYKRSTLEIAMDLQNVTNNQNVFSQNYNVKTNSTVTQYQQGFFPVPFVRFTF